jgi:hypothetical protein
MRVLVLAPPGSSGPSRAGPRHAGHDACCVGRKTGKSRQLFSTQSRLLLDLEAAAQARAMHPGSSAWTHEAHAVHDCHAKNRRYAADHLAVMIQSATAAAF